MALLLKVTHENGPSLIGDGAWVHYNGETLQASSFGRDRNGHPWIGLGHADDNGERKVVAPAIVVYLPATLSLA